MREAEKKQRRGLYAKIAIARTQLPDMDEEAYRARLRNEYGRESAAALTLAQLSRLVDDFAVRDGVVYTSKGSNKKTTPHARPDWINVPEGAPHADLKRQICAIWRKLGYSMTSLETRIKRQFGAPTLLWVHDREKLSALLTDLQARERAFEKKQAGGTSETGA